jgi:citrate lyase subunit beta/citryl-CoA lyase
MRLSTVARSVLFVPAHVARFVEKAPTAGADVICLDLEDAVPPAEKEAARVAARASIGALAEAADVWVRVNAAEGMVQADLDAVVLPGLRGVMLPKSDRAEQIQALGEAIGCLEGERGIPVGAIGIVPLIETAKGVLRAEEVCGTSARVVAAAFGSEDFVADMGVARTVDVLAYPRGHLAVACAAAGIAAIDTVDVEYRDEAHLEREMASAKRLGFSGKLCIHPVQVAIANCMFLPTEEEIKEARAIVQAFEQEGIAKGRAAISLGGKMVDTPHYERARRLLEKGEREIGNQIGKHE